MTRTEELARRWDTVMMPNYGTPPVALDHGAGVRVWDVDGREYLDFIGGIAVSSLGHAHPAIVAAVSAQLTRLVHSSNLAMHEPEIRLAERLIELVGFPGRVFFANSGAEANECAIKLSRLHGRAHGGRTELVASNGSFHGRTLGSLAITGNPAKRAPFEPLPGPVTFVDFGDVDSLRAAVCERTAAVFVETTLGEGGVVPAPPGFLAAVRAICDEAGALLVVDEVQSGIGRTGHWFASTAEGVRPDVITLAKGLGGGLPIGACIGLGSAGDLFAPGDHGSTFGGNPIACAAALAVLTTIADDQLLDSVKRVGAHLAGGLGEIEHPLVAGVRGSGLWLALALTGARASEVEAAARRRGLLVNAVKPDAIRLAPPLVLSEAEVDDALPRLAAALEDVLPAASGVAP
ncbi:MAG TPA: acetylornithine transaminase [Jatrophihabitantaceae bacterium]|jgi:acetylornithine/N-succinyldiaminopimelate aminotransferase|nr:acetylornithine transaminase [Jatrophihabitantaceae bacterium]